MVRPKAAGERRAQRRKLPAQSAARELGENLGIGGALGQGLEHGAPRNAEDIAGHRGQLDAGVLQGFVEPVRHAGAILDQRLAVPREVA
jgi:hypothetical protein